MSHFSFFARWKVLRVRRRVRIIRKMRNAEPLGQRGQAGMLEWNELLLTQPFWLDSGSQVWRKQQTIKNVRIAKADIYIYIHIYRNPLFLPSNLVFRTNVLYIPVRGRQPAQLVQARPSMRKSESLLAGGFQHVSTTESTRQFQTTNQS